MQHSGLHYEGYKEHLKSTARSLQEEAERVNKRPDLSDGQKIKKINRLIKKAITTCKDIRYNLY